MFSGFSVCPDPDFESTMIDKCFNNSLDALRDATGPFINQVN